MISSLAAMVRKVYLLCCKPRDVSRQQESVKLNNATVQQARIRLARNSVGKKTVSQIRAATVIAATGPLKSSGSLPASQGYLSCDWIL